jgi:hypothetical protein
LFNATGVIFFAIAWREQLIFQWDDVVLFVLEQQKTRSKKKPTTLCSYLIMPSADRQQMPILESFIWHDQGLNPQSIACVNHYTTNT